MIDSFLLVLKDTFFAFTLIPFSAGSYYSVSLMLSKTIMPFIAKLLGISLALILNFLVGFIFGTVFQDKKRSYIQNKRYILCIFCFIPIVSGSIAFYFGFIRAKFIKFFFVSCFSILVYSLIVIYYPIIPDISFLSLSFINLFNFR